MYGAQRITDSVLQIGCVFSCSETESHIFKYRHVRPKCEILKYKAEVSFFRWQIDLVCLGENTGIVQPDLAVIRRFQTGDHPQQRSLAATGGDRAAS